MIEHTLTPYKLLQLLYLAGSDGLHKMRIESQWCLIGAEQWEVYRALAWLVSEEQGWAECRRKMYYITSRGRETYEDVCKNPTLHQVDYHRWKEEVLTGMDAKGNRSVIGGRDEDGKQHSLAAIPGHAKNTSRAPQEAGVLGMMARELDMSVQELASKITNKQVKPCACCGKFKKIEDFHKDKRNASGVHSHCKHCRKLKAQ